MSLIRLMYISDAAVKIVDDELSALIAAASLNNETLGITGLLLYSGGHFLQVLEGEELRVNSLYSRIVLDPRHTQTRQIMLKRIESRVFPHWGMQLVNTNQSAKLDRDRIDTALVRIRLSQGDSASDALTLMNEFRAQFKSPAA
ncbi:MAG TPA: BLUF domain-containing protein [Tepidisphaeraceae bacterium]|jgi:hypothetical protein|nr:BLUF domain-containing protein [Tepidisphaeraceae bacterium]